MVRCCKAFLPILKKQSASGAHTGGRIVNVASMAGKVVGGAGFPAYGASKHAAVAFSHGLRIEVAPFGIQVCTLCPTFHGTTLVTDMSRRYDALWKTLPKDMKEEYGEGTISHRRLAAAFSHQSTNCLCYPLLERRLPSVHQNSSSKRPATHVEDGRCGGTNDASFDATDSSC
jgi:NAD(P)-dependent dehydrogenase (short-subunit alcohol dehydrogenase family)